MNQRVNAAAAAITVAGASRYPPPRPRPAGGPSERPRRRRLQPWWARANPGAGPRRCYAAGRSDSIRVSGYPSHVTTSASTVKLPEAERPQRPGGIQVRRRIPKFKVPWAGYHVLQCDEH